MNQEVPPRRFSWLRWFGALIFLFTVVGIAVAYWAYQSLAAPLKGSSQPTSFRIDSGQSVATIASNLEQAGVIRSSLALRGYLRLTSHPFKAGVYSLTSDASSLENIQPLLAGDVVERQVTIPEGLRLTEIAALLDSKQVVPAADLLAAARYHPSLVALPDRYNLKDGMFLEGFLFPDTYRFAIETTANDVIERLLTTYRDRTASLDPDYETLILASIVEREAKFDADRPLIAGVYLNRLRLGMPLQADPTVQYAVANNACSELLGTCNFSAPTTEEWKPLTAEDLTIDSPYNTYRNPGLPPTPIANPGLKSLEAAAKPTETDDLYFVTDADGHAHFATTLDEHTANVTQYLQE